jgi:hypothetical protein
MRRFERVVASALLRRVAFTYTRSPRER